MFIAALRRTEAAVNRRRGAGRKKSNCSFVKILQKINFSSLILGKGFFMCRSLVDNVQRLKFRGKKGKRL